MDIDRLTTHKDAPFGFEPGLGTLRRNWKWIALRGALSLVIGVIAFLFPISALFAFTMVFAAYAAVDGILSLVTAIRGTTRRKARWWLYIIRGFVGIATAIVFLVTPVGMTISYALFTLVALAGWAIVTGVLEVLAAIRLRKEIRGEWLMALSGVLSVALGIAVVALLVIDPLTTLPSAAWVIGTYACIAGIVLIALALRVRKT